MKKKEVNVLFVCTGNIFRSMSAEYCFKDYVKKKKIKGIKISSAGTSAKKQKMLDSVAKTLLRKKINPKNHVQRKINKKIYDENDLIVVMAKNHYEYIRKNFGEEKIVLFKDILYGKEVSLRDVNEEIPDYIKRPKETEEYTKFVVNYIYSHMDRFYKHLHKYILFRQFSIGNVKKNKGLTFVRLHETKNTLAFMSIDIPSTEDGHVVIIPKKVYLSIHYVPKHILSELIESVRLIGQAVLKTHGGYHILLNEGRASQHSMNHVHFHVIPRNKGDKIRIEGWKNKSLNKKNFEEMNLKLKKAIKKVKGQN